MSKRGTPRATLASREAANRSLGHAIREVRARRGLTQESLAQAADMHRNYVGAIERGEINPTFLLLRKVARGLGIAPSELVKRFERDLNKDVPRRRV